MQHNFNPGSPGFFYYLFFWNPQTKVEEIKITDIIQAITALIALILSITTYFQGRKIKSLTDVVSELQSNNQILSQRLEIDRSITMPVRMPIFILNGGGHYNESQKYFRIGLKNVGLQATQIRFEKKDRLTYNIKGYNGRIEYNTSIEVELRFDNSGDVVGCKIEIVLYFEDNFGVSRSQRLFRAGW